MKKLFFITYFAVTAGLIVPAAAQQYVRKQLKPEFFIPEVEFNQSEKLPPIPSYSSEDGVPDLYKLSPHAQRAIITSIIREADDDVIDDSINMEDEGETPIESVEPEVAIRNYLNYSRGEMSKVPQYKQKYNEYLKDLEYIAKSGVAPKNYNLEKDLAKMNSNERVEVDKNLGIRK